MSIHADSPFGSYGYFEGHDVTAEWTDEDWAQYDAEVAADMAAFDEQVWPDVDEFLADDAIEPF